MRFIRAILSRNVFAVQLEPKVFPIRAFVDTLPARIADENLFGVPGKRWTNENNDNEKASENLK